MLGSYLTGKLSVLTGQGSTPTATGVCAPFPGIFLTDGASFKTGTESVLTATTPPKCSCTPSLCYKIQPVIADTLVLCPFQGSLADISGNGLTPTVAAGAEHYAPLGPCIEGFHFLGETPDTNDLIFPASPLLNLTGESCFEFCILPNIGSTFVQTFFQIDPGPVLAWFINAFINLAWEGQAPPAEVDPLPLLDWPSLVNAQVPFYMQLRKKLIATDPNEYEVSCWINGVKVCARNGIGDGTVVIGQRLRMGGWSGGGPNGAFVIGNLRILGAGPSDADMLAHYEFVSGC